MLGDDVLFEYELARELHKTVAEVRNMSHAEYVGWRAYFVYEHAMADLRSRSPR